jgi:hypothetical protein
MIVFSKVVNLCSSVDLLPVRACGHAVDVYQSPTVRDILVSFTSGC